MPRARARVRGLDLHGTVVTAALGPTNTGKTHHAIQRLLGHRTGIIGLPLRLLAREVYDRVVAARGADVVALITGEERIEPPGARYWVATVESMPLHRPVAFVAVDEIQLCTHPTRGHVFTDRLLHARGVVETMFMGSDTMAPFIERLLPTAEIVRRPRLSVLRHKGPHKLTSLPPRSAVVAFGAGKVYELAERLRSRHGGTAVVLGALSPKTRNKQVEMFQAGEVPYLVATDAIGMGLNLDLDHVALAALRKFDGVAMRDLYADEVGQIAGRAGRYEKDGSFGAITDLGPMPPDLIDAVERHDYPAVPRVMWRNSELDFHGPQALLDSLEQPAPDRRFVRFLGGIDHQALDTLARREEIRQRARGVDATRLLWEVCQVPDFRNTLTDAHVELLAWLWDQLSGPGGRVEADALQQRLRRLDRTDGDIETLMGRLAWIRTWTYITHRSAWVPDPAHWQARALAIEERISDALHERLTERFVDRRSRMMGGVGGDTLAHPPEVDADGGVTVMGRAVGEVRGLSFVPDPRGLPADEPHFARLVRKLVAEVAHHRLQAVLDATDDALTVAPDGRLCLDDLPLALIQAGPEPYAPRLRLLRHDLLADDRRAVLEARLEGWLAALLDTVRGPLLRPPHERLGRAGRGLHFQLLQGLGSVPTAQVADLLPSLTDEDRKNLARLSVRVGRRHVYTQALLGPAAVRARAVLWFRHRDQALLDPLPAGSSAPRPTGVSAETWVALGYAALGPRVVRQDMLERVAAWARKAAHRGPFVPGKELLEWLGAPRDEAAGLLRALGYRPVDDQGERWVIDGRGGAGGPRGGRRRRTR